METKQNVLETLVQKLEVRNTKKRDFVAPTQKLFWEQDNTLTIANNDGNSVFINPNELFESQMSAKLGIPYDYYKKMKIHTPAIISDNVNGWLKYHSKNKYLIRGLEVPDSNELLGRAFLSNSYNCIDDYDVLFAALEAIKNTGVNVEITRAEISENRLYLHVICPEIEVNGESFLREYLKDNNAAGNGIISGFTISNSEVGKGAFEIRPRAIICKCNNGLVVKDDKFRRVHLGSKLDAGEILWSERTKSKNRELIISQVQDAVKTYLSADYLGVMIEKIADLNKINLDFPIDAVQNVCKHLGVSDEHKRNILDYFVRDGLPNAAGIYNAVTRETQNMDVDTQHEIEGVAMEFISTPKKYDKLFSKN